MATGRIGTTPVLQVRWSKAPSAGTTSLSGLDDNSVSLVYSVGYEAVYRNGVLLSRGNDYTATNGTTVTLIDATITGDIIEIFANQTVPLSDTFSQTVADGRFIKNTLTTTTGDIIYASAANTPARLGIGSSAQVLTVSGGIPAWTTPASAGFTLISTTATTSGTSITISSIPTTPYTNLLVQIDGVQFSTAHALQFRFYNNNNSYGGGVYNSTAFSSANYVRPTGTNTSSASHYGGFVVNNFQTTSPSFFGGVRVGTNGSFFGGGDNPGSANLFTSLVVTSEAGTGTFNQGQIKLWGI